MNGIAAFAVVWAGGWLGTLGIILWMLRLWSDDGDDDSGFLLDDMEDQLPLVAAKLLLAWPYILIKLYRALTQGES